MSETLRELLHHPILDMLSGSIFMITFQTEERNRLFTADAEETELVFYFPFTLLEHRSRQGTKTRKRSKSRKLRGGKPRTERVRRAL